MTWKIILAFLLITINPKQIPKTVVQVQPVALEIIASDFDQVLVFIFDEQHTQDQIDKFQAQAIRVNQTFPNDNTLYAISNKSKDASGQLSRYGDSGIKFINRVNQYHLHSQHINQTYNFYNQNTRPKLAIKSWEQVSKQAAGNILIIYKYQNQTKIPEIKSINNQLFHYLNLFKVNAFAVKQQNMTSSLQISAYNLSKDRRTLIQKGIYANQISDLGSLVQFINVQTLPEVSFITESNYFRIFGSHLDRQMLLIYDQKHNQSEQIKSVKKSFLLAAKRNIEQDLKSQRIIFGETTKDFIAQFFQEGIIDLQKDYQILLTKTNFNDFSIMRYLYTKEIVTVDNLVQFIDDVYMKRINPTYKSQDVPSEQQQMNNNPIRKIVGKTFIEEIFQRPDQNIIVLFIDSKDKDSYQSYLKTLKEFGMKYQDILKDKIILCSFDLARNEHQLLTIRDAPKLVIFQRENKKKPKQFRGEISIKGLRDWINFEVEEVTIAENYGQKPLSLGPTEL